MGRTMRCGGVAVLALLLAAVTSECHAEELHAEELTQVAMDGTIGCKWWRMRSITKSVGPFWQLRTLQFFESKDGSGTPVTVEAPNSEDEQLGAHSSTYKGAPKPGQPDTSPHKAAMAVDGPETKYGDDKEGLKGEYTFWSSSADLKFEFVSVKFKSPKDIRSVKAQLTSADMGPTMVIVEKSMDGENWSRSTEISDMKSWGTKLETYPLINMDVQPPSVFALRSQENPYLCVGVKPKQKVDDAGEDIPDMFDNLAEGQPLVVQVCSDNTVEQYWQLDEDDRFLRNAKNRDMIVHVDELKNGGKLTVKKYVCEVGEDGKPGACPSWGVRATFSFAPEEKGGLILNHHENFRNLILSMADLKADAAVVLGTCGTKGTESADIKNCAPVKAGSQFELKPMFLIEKQKQALGCGPYSHQKIEPKEAKDETTAMELCAANANCLAYNYAKKDDSTVCGKEPPCQGKYTGHVWLCEDLHEVHSGVTGWSLGLRAGRLEPFVEEEFKLK